MVLMISKESHGDNIYMIYILNATCIFMVLMKSKESHGDWLAVGFNSDLTEALNTKYKVFLFLLYINAQHYCT